jgi:hypothetical protein
VNDIYCGSLDRHPFGTSVVAMQQLKMHGQLRPSQRSEDLNLLGRSPNLQLKTWKMKTSKANVALDFATNPSRDKSSLARKR